MVAQCRAVAAGRGALGRSHPERPMFSLFRSSRDRLADVGSAPTRLRSTSRLLADRLARRLIYLKSVSLLAI